MEEKNEENQISRRVFLKKAGATVVLISMGGLIWRAVDTRVFQTASGPAYELWDADVQATGSLALIADAVMASNPHNTQPWLFKVTDHMIELYADEARNLGVFDPYRREMHIGLGCALENLVISAQAHGYQPEVQLVPDSIHSTLAARVVLEEGATITTPLYESIRHRHTHRGQYDTSRTISNSVYEDIQGLVSEVDNVRLTWFTANADKARVGQFIIEATEAIIADDEMSKASNKWYRDDWESIQEHRDGLTLDAQGTSFFIRLLGKMLPSLSHERNDQFWLSATKDTHTATAAAYGMIAVKDPTNMAQKLQAGRAWQRIHLYGASLGLGLHPMNQLNEMSDREQVLKLAEHHGARLKQLTAASDWQGIFIFRIGYPLKDTYPSPRRPLEAVVRS